MAEGCNLYLTRSDIKQVKKAVDVGQKTEVSKISREILNATFKNERQKFMNVLSNKNHPSHKLTKELLVKSLGEDKVTKSEENRLTDALYTVLKNHPNPQGLFKNPPKYRGPGADAMSHPYELLSTAAIIQNEVPTSLGTKLKIYLTDRVDFGQKLAAKYALSSRKEGTIEADTLIEIKRPSERGIIAIDSKYTKGSTYGLKPDSDRQFKGIKNAFNDGQLKEFYFVTNAEFNKDFKDKVDDYNIQIFKEEAERDNKLFKEFENHLIKEERKGYIQEDFKDAYFKNNIDLLNEITQKYKIPQIGLCEKVNYEKY